MHHYTGRLVRGWVPPRDLAGSTSRPASAIKAASTIPWDKGGRTPSLALLAIGAP